MLRSFANLFKGQRVRSVVVDNESPVSTDNIAQESRTHQSQTMPSVVNAGANRFSTTLAPMGEFRVDFAEGGQIDHNFKWVEVDLSPVESGGIREDACKVQLKVVGANRSADCAKPDLRGIGDPSTSHSQDASLADKRSSSIEISMDQQHQLQQHSITITVQMPPPQQNSVDSCKGQETPFARTVSAVSTDSLAEHCRSSGSGAGWDSGLSGF